MRAGLYAALLLLAAIALGGCFSDEQIFAGGRIEDLCNGVVPQCRLQAGCVLDEAHFVRGRFPGEQRVVVRTERVDATLVVRLLLTKMIFPGTELLVEGFSPDCGNSDLEQLVDVDLFEYAGDDRILEFHLEMGEAGDHLLSVYSDMDAEYLMTVTVEEEP
ncbi:MAG: hypothetical protein D6729_03550 [Deltaproteobacteria bacterium]|nr:MAG: hypothetical protein D6729_03550 [Deltaproteobacteria bacterium]